MGDEIPHRIAHHVDGFVERRAERFGDMAVPRLGHDAGHRCAGVDEIGQDGVILGPDPRTARRPEGDQRRRGELQLMAGPGEELDVLGVGPGPSALDEGDAQMVELLGHPELVGHGQGKPFLLAPVAQDRVEDVDRLRQLGHLVVVRQMRVPVGRTMCVRMAPFGAVRMAPFGAVGMAPFGAVGMAVSRHGQASSCSGRPRPARWRSRSAAPRRLSVRASRHPPDGRRRPGSGRPRPRCR